MSSHKLKIININERKISLWIILLIAFSVLTGCGYKDYDSCIIGEMKGQDRAVFSTVKRVCESQHPFEKNLSARRDISISWNHNSNDHKQIDFYASVGALPYTITRAKVSFHFEDCGLLKYDTSPHKTVWLTFDNGMSNTKIDEARSYNCMKTLDVYGIYRNVENRPRITTQKFSLGWMSIILNYAAEASVMTLVLFSIVWFLMRKRGSAKLRLSYVWFLGGFLITTIAVGLIRFLSSYVGFKAALAANTDGRWLFFVIIPVVVSVLVCAIIRTRYTKLTDTQVLSD